MRSPQLQSPIAVDKYDQTSHYVSYSPFYPHHHHPHHPSPPLVKATTADSSSSSSFSPRSSPPSPLGDTMSTRTSPSQTIVSSAPFRPAPMRLPSFAELNERLSLSMDKEMSFDSRDRGELSHQRMPPSPSMHSSMRYTGLVYSPRLESSAEAKDAHSSAVKGTQAAATGEDGRGLTSSWLPIDDPGRSAGIPSHARRATVSTYEQPSPHYSWSPRQQSPSWNSSSSSGGPTPVTSSSNRHNRYHPFKRAPSFSPEESHSQLPKRSHPSHHPSYTQSQPLRSPLTSHEHRRLLDTGNGDAMDAGQGVSTIPRRRGKLPKDVTERLRNWLMEHSSHPYPNEDEKRRLCMQTGLSISQVSNWFINARRRILAPQLGSTGSSGPPVGMSSLPGPQRHLQSAQLHPHHQQYPQPERKPYQNHQVHQEAQRHHHQPVHVPYSGQYASPDPRRPPVIASAHSITRRDSYPAERNLMSTHSEPEYHRRR